MERLERIEGHLAGIRNSDYAIAKKMNHVRTALIVLIVVSIAHLIVAIRREWRREERLDTRIVDRSSQPRPLSPGRPQAGDWIAKAASFLPATPFKRWLAVQAIILTVMMAAVVVSLAVSR